jgi:hypothetical protein
VNGTGAPCTSDAQCAGGYCITEAEAPDYVGGYCSAGCTYSSDCPGAAVCVNDGGGNYCLADCSDDDDCRANYVCDGAGGVSWCVPRLGGAGGSLDGDGCDRSSDCATDGAFCFGEEYGFPGGICTAECAVDDDCGFGAICSAGWCAESCTQNRDCRGGYACWPESDRAGVGACWTACTSDAECDGWSCNEHGLCGDLVPPAGVSEDPEVVAQPPSGQRRPPPPPIPMQSGCAAAASSLWLTLGAGAVLLRRRRLQGVGTTTREKPEPASL